MNDVVLGYALMFVRDKLQESEHENEQYARASVALDTDGRSSPRARKPAQQSARRDSFATGAINRLL